MKSRVWGNDECPVDQPYGCTSLPVEPPDPSCLGGHFHCGIDVGMVVGTPLFAARAGVVDYVGYGLLAAKVGNEHDWYVHIDKVAPGISAFTGAPIDLYQFVAFSGNKAPAGGFTTGPHLHFETNRGPWLNLPKTSVNPVPILEGVDQVAIPLFIDPGGAVYTVDAAGKRHVGPKEYQMYVDAGLAPSDPTGLAKMSPAAESEIPTSPSKATSLTFTGTANLT